MGNNGKSGIQLITTTSSNHTNSTTPILNGSGAAMKKLLEEADCPKGLYKLELTDNGEQHGKGVHLIRLNKKNQIEVSIQHNSNGRNCRNGLLFCPDGKHLETWRNLCIAKRHFFMNIYSCETNPVIKEAVDAIATYLAVILFKGHVELLVEIYDKDLAIEEGNALYVKDNPAKDGRIPSIHLLVQCSGGRSCSVRISSAQLADGNKCDRDVLASQLLQSGIIETGVIDDTGEYHPTPKKPFSPTSALAIAEELAKIGQFPIVEDTETASTIVKEVATKSGEDIDYTDCFYSKPDNGLCHPTEHLCNLLLELPKEGKSKEIFTNAFNHLKQQEARLLQKSESLSLLRAEQECHIGKIEEKERKTEALIATLQQRQTDLSEEKRQAKHTVKQADSDLSETTNQIDKIKEIYDNSDCQLVATHFGINLSSSG